MRALAYMGVHLCACTRLLALGPVSTWVHVLGASPWLWVCGVQALPFQGCHPFLAPAQQGAGGFSDRRGGRAGNLGGLHHSRYVQVRVEPGAWAGNLCLVDSPWPQAVSGETRKGTTGQGARGGSRAAVGALWAETKPGLSVQVLACF